MSVFMDLNICYTPDRNRLKSLVETAANRECLQPGFPRKSASNSKTLPSDDANSASKLLQFCSGSRCYINVVPTENCQRYVSLLLPVVQIICFINSYCFLDEQTKD